MHRETVPEIGGGDWKGPPADSSEVVLYTVSQKKQDTLCFIALANVNRSEQVSGFQFLSWSNGLTNVNWSRCILPAKCRKTQCKRTRG